MKNAESVPGLRATWMSAVRATAVSRGSITIRVAPRSRAPHTYWVMTGKHSPTLDPAMSRQSVRRMSEKGLAARSMPKASLLAPAAETMHSRPL
ncbi:hypothetical protein A8W25_12240 [Streptomyces sp. ERV7]|nr:hypothetical protein A8W25_12240 [Streptomyces sp. ERV7]